MLGLIIVSSLIGGVFSLVGGVILLTRKEWSDQAMLTLVSFAAGVLLSVSFLDLLPEAVELAESTETGYEIIFYVALSAIVFFFIFERLFSWFHYHQHDQQDQIPEPVIPMIIIGDTIHNFVDGLVITAGFLTSIPLGIATAIAAAAHEIPQEIADFSLLLSKGMKRSKVLVLNVTSSLATTLGAVLGFFFWTQLSILQPHLLAFTAGMFIYIAASDLIPELHHRQLHSYLQILAFLFGIALTLGIGMVFG